MEYPVVGDNDGDGLCWRGHSTVGSGPRCVPDPQGKDCGPDRTSHSRGTLPLGVLRRSLSRFAALSDFGFPTVLNP